MKKKALEKVFISEADQYLFAQGTHYDIYKKLTLLSEKKFRNPHPHLGWGGSIFGLLNEVLIKKS